MKSFARTNAKYRICNINLRPCVTHTEVHYRPYPIRLFLTQLSTTRQNARLSDGILIHSHTITEEVKQLQHDVRQHKAESESIRAEFSDITRQHNEHMSHLEHTLRATKDELATCQHELKTIPKLRGDLAVRAYVCCCLAFDWSLICSVACVGCSARGASPPCSTTHVISVLHCSISHLVVNSFLVLHRID